MIIVRRFSIIFIFLLSTITFLPAAAYAYTDTDNHWANKEISFLSSQGIIGGYSDNSFKPENYITRAEFCKMIVSSLRLNSEAYSLQEASSSFKDVKDNHWAKGYIELVYELGIVKGDGGGFFRPEAYIRRDEASAVLVRALKLNGYYAEVELDFNDADLIPAWAHVPVSLAIKNDLIKGFPDNTFRASLKATRAETTVLVNRMLVQRGDEFQLFGIIKSIDTIGRRVRIAVDDKDYIIDYSSKLNIFDDRKKLNINDLKEKAPHNIAIVLNKNGIVEYIEIVSDENTYTAFSLKNELISSVDQEFDFFENMSGNFMGIANSFSDPAKSLEVNRKEMNVDLLADATGADGSGQIIAVIDTGADPGHPDLAYDTNSDTKIVDWMDFTDEGKISTSNKLKAGKYRYTIDDSSYKTGKVDSTNDIFYYGFIKESELLRDLNSNGNMKDEFFAIITNSSGKGYDTVYIDTDCDKDLSDEKVLKIYPEEPQYFDLCKKTDESYKFVIADIDPEGKWFKIGCDFNGHGTHVAGIAAANGEIKGIAPGAKLMIIKALNSNGETEWEVLQQAIKYAAENNADIINLSLGYYKDKTAGNNSLTELISNVSKKYGVIVTVATGNRGPGIASLATPGNAKDAISVGAYISTEMWKELYGWDVKKDSLWYYSSVGPRKDGLMVPLVVAPGSAVSTAPLWSGNKYYLAEGTSMAAPHAAGAVALLLDAVNRMDKVPEPEEVRKAVFLGAKNLTNFDSAEVGAGVIDVVEAWRKLLLVEDSIPIEIQTYNRRFVIGKGLYSREYLPGKIFFKVKNNFNKEIDLNWSTTAKWLKSDVERTRIAPNSYRDIIVSYDIPEEPGLYSAILRGDVEGTYGYDVMALSTVIRPYILNEENQFKIAVDNALEAAQYKRYFIKVPPESGQLNVKLEVPKLDKILQGRVRFHLIDPGGNEYEISDYAGVAFEGEISQNKVNMVVDEPVTGTWEIVVYSSASLSSYDLKESYYKLEVFLNDIKETPEKDYYNSWFVNASVSSRFIAGEKGYITFHVIDKSSMKPVNRVIEINNKLYQVKNGRITLHGSEYIN